MSNQLVISSGAKVRELEGVLTGTSGIVNALAINVANGIPQLDGSGKILVSQLPNSVMEYKGSWNAATNTPTLVNGTGNAGDVYLCEVAGTVNFGAGPITFAVGDQVVYSGSIWQRASGATGTVTSVAVSRDGDALTITGSPITTSGTINIGFTGGNGQYINGEGDLVTFPSLTGFVPYTGATASVDLGAFSLTADTLYSVDIFSIGSGTQSGYIGIKQGTTFLGNISGYNSINANATKFILISDIGSTNYKSASFQLSSLTNNTERTYTLPDLSGTLALLEGTQTFTGDKLFNGSVDFNNSVNINSGLFIRNNVISSTLYTSFTITKASSTQTLSYLFSTGFASNLLFNDAANYNYTFPAASGTVALTSDLSSYVPYTGATANVDLGTFDLTADVITGATGSFASSGGSDTFAINHSSGSGIALNITKGGNGEGLYINKTSGSGNAATIVGNLGGTSATFSSTLGVTGALNGTSATFSNNISVSGVTIGKGRQAGTGTSNIGIGFAALAANTTGINNLAIGSGTLYNNTTGDNNISLGYNTLEYNTTGGSNIALGLNTLGDNTTGNNNIGIGIQALDRNTTADGNIAIGYGALGLNTTGVYNTAIGYIAGSAITTGSYNTIVGRYVGTTTMDNNIILADGAGNIRYQWDGTNNVFGNPISGTSATFSGALTFANGGGNYLYGGALRVLYSNGTNTNNIYSGGVNGLRVINQADTLALMQITDTGNLGLGVTPSADIWSSFKGIQINAWGGGIFSGSAVTNFVHNNYYDGTNFKYFRNGSAAIYQQNGNIHAWYNAPSGTAGNNATFTQAMTLTAGGNLGIGDTSPFASLTVANKTAYAYNTAIFGNSGWSYLSAGSALYIGQGATTGNTYSKIFAVGAGGGNYQNLVLNPDGGNVGIGTSSPSTKLHVQGSFTQNDAIGYGLLENTSTSSGTADTNVSLIVKNYHGTSQFMQWEENGMRIGSRIVTNGGVGSLYFTTGNDSVGMLLSGSDLNVTGALSKGSGSFKIDHPLESMTETHHLVHSFVESPQANNIYRGKVELKNGVAQVNLDEVSTMTEGTFVILNREIHTYTSNETDWDAVRGKVEGNILTIECQNNQSNAIVSWLVIGERQDKHMMDTGWTDENGRVIVEPLKEIKINNPIQEDKLDTEALDINLDAQIENQVNPPIVVLPLPFVNP
jgi:hypothetical protein